MTTVHVLGNGPSVRYFESDLFHDEPTDGIRVSCNKGHPHLNCEFTACDEHFLWTLCENFIPFTTPIVTKLQYLKHLKTITKNSKHLLKLNISVYPRSIDEFIQWGFSSGHSATACSIVWYQPYILHLWGIDSFWTNDSTSIHDSSDRKFFHITLWRENWNKIFNAYPKTQFVIHAPTPIENLPKNVITERL